MLLESSKLDSFIILVCMLHFYLSVTSKQQWRYRLDKSAVHTR